MDDAKSNKTKSRELAVGLYETWVKQRQDRPPFTCSEKREDVDRLARENVINQRIKPRKSHLEQLKKAGRDMTTADKVALLVMLEFPVLETSTLLHRLTGQLGKDPQAKYFSRENMLASCGCGCG